MRLKKHKHKFKMVSHSRMNGEWRCKCNDVHTRDFTSEEQELIDSFSEKMFMNESFDSNVHRHYHPFVEDVCEESPVMDATVVDGKLEMIPPPEYDNMQRFHKYVDRFKKETGLKVFYSLVRKKYDDNYQEMKRVQNYTEEHPSIKVVGCDDDYHASSDLVLVPHESDYEWMGLSVQYIPQCTGEKSIRFFLYPSNLDKFIKTLKHYQKCQRKRRHKNKERDKLERKVWNMKYESKGDTRGEADNE